MRRFHLRRLHLAIGGSALVVLVAAGVAMAVNRAGDAITAVRAVESSAGFSTTSTTFVNLPGALTNPITVAGGEALMLVRFSAESTCAGSDSINGCSVRILLVPTGGTATEALPAQVGNEFFFDQDGDEQLNGAHSMDRWLVVGAGQWRARVQYRVIPVGVSGTTTFTLDDWSLILERADR